MAAAKLKVDTIVVVAHEVTMEPGQCELLVDSGPVLVVDSLAVDLLVDSPVDALVEPDAVSDVWDPDVVVDGPGPLEDVGELVVADEVETGTPHSSKLWPCATVRWLQLSQCFD